MPRIILIAGLLALSVHAEAHAQRDEDWVRIRERQAGNSFTARPNGGDWREFAKYDHDRLESGQSIYDPARYYRGGRTALSVSATKGDRVYRGLDGRYYCRRQDGTTGRIYRSGWGEAIARGSSRPIDELPDVGTVTCR